MAGEPTAPWIYVRAKIAERWGVTPWQVDDAPPGEIDIQLELWGIEHKYTPRD